MAYVMVEEKQRSIYAKATYYWPTCNTWAGYLIQDAQSFIMDLW